MYRERISNRFGLENKKIAGFPKYTPGRSPECLLFQEKQTIHTTPQIQQARPEDPLQGRRTHLQGRASRTSSPALGFSHRQMRALLIQYGRRSSRKSVLGFGHLWRRSVRQRSPPLLNCYRVVCFQPIQTERKLEVGWSGYFGGPTP